MYHADRKYIDTDDDEVKVSFITLIYTEARHKTFKYCTTVLFNGLLYTNIINLQLLLGDSKTVYLKRNPQ